MTLVYCLRMFLIFGFLVWFYGAVLSLGLILIIIVILSFGVILRVVVPKNADNWARLKHAISKLLFFIKIFNSFISLSFI